MFNHILISLDGSVISEEALPYAQKLLRAGGKVTLVCAVDLSGLLAYDTYPITGVRVDMHGDPVYGADKLVAQAKSYLDKMTADLTGFEVNCVVEIGEPSELIVQTATKAHVDAIVMSTHGRSGLTRWLLGSVTNRVLSSAHCPVLVIPNRHRQPTTEIKQEAVHA